MLSFYGGGFHETPPPLLFLLLVVSSYRCDKLGPECAALLDHRSGLLTVAVGVNV